MTKLYHSDGITPYPYWHIGFRPTGAINASAKDVANYVRFYLQRGSLDGTRLLGVSSIERMERTETLPSAKLGNVAGYGLYNYATLEGAFVFRGHNGGMAGGLTEMAYLSVRKLFGKLPDADPLSVRIMPLVSTVLLILFFVLFAVKRDGLRAAFTGDPADCVSLGVPSVLTVSIMLSTIAFALATLAVGAIRYEDSDDRKNLGTHDR